MLYDCSLSGWGMLQRHPFITAIILEPIIFAIAIYLMVYSRRLKKSLRWRFVVNVSYTSLVVLSALLFTIGVFLGMIGLISGAVIANGYGALSYILAIYMPIMAGFAICRMTINGLGYCNIDSYVNDYRWY